MRKSSDVTISANSTSLAPCESTSVPVGPRRLKRLRIEHRYPTSFAEGVRDLSAAVPSRKLVFLVHGINSRGQNLSKIIPRMRDGIVDHNIAFVPLRYDPFGRVQAFIYALTGWKPRALKRLERDMQAQMLEHGVTRPSIIAHSFGTYVVMKLMESNPELKLHHVIMCASVVDENYDWCGLRGRMSSITNDCGMKDCVPLRAAWFRLFGKSGRIGFKSACVVNRYFKNMDHSDFFTEKFDIEYWSEIVVNDELIIPAEGDGFASY